MDYINVGKHYSGAINFHGLKIGGTPLRDVPQLSGRYGCHVLVKDESVNEASGTFKDRRNAAILLDDKAVPGKIWYVQISSGNSALSMGRLCDVYNREEGYKYGKERRVLNIVDPRIHENIKRAISVYGRVHEMDLKNNTVPNNTLDEIGRQIVGDREATYKAVEHIGDLGDGYGSLSAELYPEGAAYWFLPGGEWEFMTKLALEVHGKPNKPKIVGVTIDDNVITTRKKFHKRVRRSPADKLVAAYSDFREMLELLCKEDGHEIITVSDRQIMQEFDYINRELHMRAEPSAAAAFAGVKKYAPGNLTVHDKVIIINTGYGLYEPVSTMPQIVTRVAASVLAASALIGTSSYVSDKVGQLRHAYEQVREQEEIDIKTLEGQREYLTLSTTDPIEAFAWYRASIKPLEGSGSLLAPQVRKFVLVPDHGTAGWVRRSIEISSGRAKYYDNWEISVTSKAHMEFNEFLKVREQLMKTSVYTREH